MTLPALVSASQILSAMAWLFVTYHYAPSFVRVMRGAPMPWDGAGCWAVAAGLVQTGFTLRWVAMPNTKVAEMEPTSLVVWIALYFMNAMVAIGILHTWRDTDIEASKGRARWALIAWLVLAVSCAGAASWAL